MLWIDVDHKIATRCILSISGDSAFFEYSRRHGIYAPILAQKVGNHTSFILLMKKSRNDESFTALFPRIFNGLDRGDSWLIKIPPQSFPELSIIDKITEIPSVIMQHIYLEDGRLFIDLRFHEGRSQDISDLIRNYWGDGERKIALEALIPRSGAVSFLKEVNSRTPLTLIIYSIPAFNRDPIERYLSSNDSIAEIEKKPGPNYRALIFSKSPIKKEDDLITISEKDNIYETWGNNPILQEIRNVGNNNSILRLTHFLSVHEGRLVVSVFIHTEQANDFIRIISGIRLETDKHPVRLLSVQEYREDLINSIGYASTVKEQVI